MFCFRKEPSWPKDFIPPFLVCGLDNAGKTTIIGRIKASDNTTKITTVPTVGFVPNNVKIGSKSIRLYDVGGGERIRGIWSSYFAECYGIIYVIDATDITRIPETAETFQTLTKHDHLNKKPILILANKQDSNGALNASQISDKLNAVGEKVHVCECSGIQQTLDKNIKNGLLWILKYITDNHDELLSKVSTDLSTIEEERKKERAARQERIRKAREEREKEESQKEKSVKEEDSDDDDMVCSPFKPIKQAFSDAASPDVISSPSPESPTKKSKKFKKKMKRKGNKITPFNSNEGSQKSLLSNDSTETDMFSTSDNKLPPISTKISLPNVSSDIQTGLMSSLPPIINNKTDDNHIQKAKLVDLVDNNLESASLPKDDNSVSIPGIFQNKYVSVDSLSSKPPLEMKSLHTIRVDRSIFNDNIAMNC